MRQPEPEASGPSPIMPKTGRMEVTLNVADWYGRGQGVQHVKDNLKPDHRNDFELGWHAAGEGSEAYLKFKACPDGHAPRIHRVVVDCYAMFTGRGQTSPKPRAVALHAVHALNNFSTDEFTNDKGEPVPHCRECMLWLQTPFTDSVPANQNVSRDVGHLSMGLLVPHKMVKVKMSVFANANGDEVLSEITASLEYSWEKVA